ncbi:MAG: OFA family MFS transporter [Candidatus Hydrogenedentes bacterium]|jgi:MFS family permease|nr:OFA family MFS transporter [Candidatus Hydrogenedentota bacterium]
MAENKIMNRWIIVAGAILIQLSLGAIYAWSVFTGLLTNQAGPYKFTATQTQLIFSAGLAFFAVVMVIAGRMQAKVGPRPIALAGGVVLGLGYILGGLFGTNFIMQLLCIGVIGGTGIGLAYVVPIAVCVKWFPDKKGMITGFAVAGFGFGATLWVKLGDSWFGGLLNNLDGMLGLPGVQAVFFVYGMTFLVLVVLGSLVMVNPPANYVPAGWTPPVAAAGGSTGQVDFTERQMLKTPQFYMLWLTFMASAMAGLMVIGIIKLFGIDALQASGTAATANEAGIIAGTAMALFAILNGLGRIIWGTISDKLGRKSSIVLMCFLQGIMLLAFYKMGGSKMGFIVGACIIGFNFGGNFALFASATADFFGNKNVGLNYGYVFLSYGVAGIVGPQIAGYFKDRAPVGTADVTVWLAPMVIAGIACLAVAVLMLALKSPKAPQG